MAVLIVESAATDRLLLSKILERDHSKDRIFFNNLSELNASLFGTDRSPVPYQTSADIIIMPMDPLNLCLELARKIKEHPSYVDIPLLLVSQQARPESIQVAFAFGASDFVEKPFREMELLARIRSCIRLKHEIDQRKARERELLETAKQMADLNRILVQLSMVDSLTGVANRRCFDISLEREWRRGFRAKSPLSLLMIDIDYFKNYNDTFGHRAGDECLSLVARLVQSCLNRPGDILTRYGGEEFAAILPDTGHEGALTVAEEIRLAVEQAAFPAANSAVVTLSIGVTTVIPEQNFGPERLVEVADQALYEAKRRGRNQVASQTQPKNLTA